MCLFSETICWTLPTCLVHWMKREGNHIISLMVASMSYLLTCSVPMYWAHTLCETPRETPQTPKMNKKRPTLWTQASHSRRTRNHEYRQLQISVTRGMEAWRPASPSQLGHQGGFSEEVTAEKSLKRLKEEISQRRRESRHSRQKYQSLEKQGCGREQGVAGEESGWGKLVWFGGRGKDGIVKAFSICPCLC